jgi:hypothetical protein
MRVCIDATRIADGRPVMLKRLPTEEGPYELQINKLFSTEPLYSNPQNHCVPLLDVIELPDDPPIIVNSLLRPFYDPQFQTFGEFVTFFAQVCEVSLLWRCISLIDRAAALARVYNSCMRTMLLIGMIVNVFLSFSCSHSRPQIISGTAHRETSCLTRHICIQSPSTPLT